MKHILSTIALCGILALAPAIIGGQNGFTAQAQDNVNVTGTVVDENGEPMLGAGVVVKGTTTGTTVDLDGNFTLNAPVGSVLQIITVGYTTVEVTVNGAGSLGTIAMEPENTLLDQVVVIGYGSQKKVDLTGSVAIVYADEMKKLASSLASVNAMYEMQLQTSTSQLEATKAVEERIQNMMANFADSAEGVLKYKDQVDALTRKVAELNNVYGNMLAAMQTRL